MVIGHRADRASTFLLPNVEDHRAGPGDQGKSEPVLSAGSGASPC